MVYLFNGDVGRDSLGKSKVIMNTYNNVEILKETTAKEVNADRRKHVVISRNCLNGIRKIVINIIETVNKFKYLSIIVHNYSSYSINLYEIDARIKTRNKCFYSV